MKIFLDANVLVSVLNRQYPVFPYAARVLSLADNPAFEVFTTPLCLAIAFYFSAKKSGEDHAKKKMAVLTQKLKITPNQTSAILETIKNPKISDFEDGLEYYAAKEAKCDIIITEDHNDFWFSEIEVLNCMSFTEKL
jgi:predicted nucleic acid-binding protein